MSKEQFTPRGNDEDDLTDLIDAVYSKSKSYGNTSATPEARTDKKEAISPEKNTEENKKKPLTKIAVGALAVTMAIGGIVGLGKLTEKTASAEITIYDPKNAQEQICNTQATLEESLGLPKSTSYDTLSGCDGTVDMVAKTGEGLKPGDKVEVAVTSDAFGGAATAEKVND